MSQAVIAFALMLGLGPLGPAWGHVSLTPGIPKPAIPRVSVAWGTALGRFFASSYGNPSGMLRAAAVLGNLDFLLPEPRASLAPAVSELANLGYTTPEGFSRLDGTSQRVLVSAAIHLASRKLEERARELAKEAERQADRQVLANAVSGMQEIKTYFPMYLQAGSLQGLERSHARASEKLSTLLAARLEDEVGREVKFLQGQQEGLAGSETLSVPGSEQAQQTPAVQEAKGLVKSLLNLDESGQRKALVEWMLDLVVRDQEEAAHRILVRGLLEELARTSEQPYPLREVVLRALEEIGLKTPFENVREQVVSGLADSLFGPEGVYYSQLAIQSLRAVAVHTPSRTKGLALALLERELASASLEGYGERVREAQKESIRRIMDRIRDSAGEEALEQPPVPAKPQPPQGAKPGLLAQLRQWVRRHPLAAFFGLLSLLGLTLGLLLRQAPR